MSAIQQNNALGNQFGHIASQVFPGHRTSADEISRRFGQRVNLRNANRANRVLTKNINQPHGKGGISSNLAISTGRMVGNQIANLRQPAGFSRRTGGRSQN